MELVTVLLLSEVRSSGSESPSEVTRSEHGWRIEDKTTTRTYDKVTSGPLHAHYPMGTGHGPKGSRSPRECTDGVAHLLATGFAKPTGTQLFVRFFSGFLLSSLAPMAQERRRPASSVEGIDGRDGAPGEKEQVFFNE